MLEGMALKRFLVLLVFPALLTSGLINEANTEVLRRQGLYFIKKNLGQQNGSQSASYEKYTNWLFLYVTRNHFKFFISLVLPMSC
jgi:hypothetical protein